jgi:hypothetical protein
MSHNGESEVPKRLSSDHDRPQLRGADADDIWSLAAGEIPPERLNEVFAMLAINPIAREELRLAWFMLDDGTDGSRVALDLDRVMERIHEARRASDRVSMEFSLVRMDASEPTSIGFRVLVRPRASCHVLLIAVAVTGTGHAAFRLFPAEPPVSIGSEHPTWPTNPLPGGVFTELPPSGCFTLPSLEGFVALCTPTSGMFDEASMMTAQQLVLESIRTHRCGEPRSAGRATTSAHLADITIEWRSFSE